jgi:hypothetical protein
MREPESEQRTGLDEIEDEVREIAQVLLTEHPPGTSMSEVWLEALTLHAVRYETEVLPPTRNETGPTDQPGPLRLRARSRDLAER